MSSLETLEGHWRMHPGGLAFAAYAEALESAGRRDEAFHVLSEGVTRWPRNLAGRLVYASIAREAGDLESARAGFQAALDIDGNSRAALRGMADVCTRQQYLKQAFETWSRLAILDPDDAEAAEAARSAATRMDSSGGFGIVDVRETEDLRSREALSEGAGTQSAFGNSQAAMATIPEFDLNLPEFGSPSSLVATAGFPAPTMPDLPGFGEISIPVPSAVEPPPAAPLSSPSLGKFEESAFATLEMPSFPSKTIPPPPLELPKAPPTEALLPTASGLMHPAGANPFAISEERLQMAEATQMIPAPGRSPAPVTGDDIEDRLDEVFGAASSIPMPPSMPPLSTSQDASAAPAPSRAPAAAPEASTKVTGDDVEDRLGELFGETGEMSLASLKPTPAVVKPANPVVSGNDIEGRLDDLFGESVIDLTSSHPQPGDSKVADTAAFLKEEVQAPEAPVFARSGDTTIESRVVAGEARPGAESTTELHTSSLRLNPEQMVDLAAKGSEVDQTGSTLDLPTAEFNTASDTRMSPRLTAEDVDSRLDELFASSEFLADPATASRRTGFVAKPPATEPGVVTGNDIEGRLDDLFGGDSDFPVSLPTVTFAEEYLRQGHKEKAVAIYRQLLDRDPSNSDLRRRLDEIEGRA